MLVKKYVKRKTKRMYGGSFVPKTRKTLKHRALAFGAKTAAYLTPKWMVKPFMSQAFRVASQAKQDIKKNTDVTISKRQMAIIAAKVYGSLNPEKKAFKLISKKVIKSAKKAGKVLTKNQVEAKVRQIVKIAVTSVEKQTTIPGIRIETGVKSGVEAVEAVEAVKAVQEMVRSNPLVLSKISQALMNLKEKQALGKGLGSVLGGIPGPGVGSRVVPGEAPRKGPIIQNPALASTAVAQPNVPNPSPRVLGSLIPNPALAPAQALDQALVQAVPNRGLLSPPRS